MIFVNEVSGPLTSLVKKIDEVVEASAAKHPGGQQLGVFLIFGETDCRAAELEKLAKKESLKRISLCIGAAPPRYEVNKEADVTVVIYTVGRPGRQEVSANFTLRKGELDDTKRDLIVSAVSKVLPK